MCVLTAASLIKNWREHPNRFPTVEDGSSIWTPRLQASAYVDVVELLMAFGGCKSWHWVDARGKSKLSDGLGLAMVRLARDATALAPLMVQHYLRAKEIRRRGRPSRPVILERGGLYLRLDHNFDLKGGGSVTHTAGVINAMRRLLSRLQVLSTDTLPLVAMDADFHELVPRYGIGRNVPGLPELAYSQQVVNWFRRGRHDPPGFVYARYSIGNYAPPLLARFWRVPYVCEYNGSVGWIARHWGNKRLRFENVFMAVEEANLHAADLVVAVSKASRDELVARGLPVEKVLVNPNGVDSEAFSPSIDGSVVRARYGIESDEIVIGFIGTFGAWHGAEILAAAFGKLLRSGRTGEKRIRLLLVGDGPRMGAVENALEEAQVNSRVVFCGIVPHSEAPRYLAACNILASPHVPNPDGSPFFGSPTKLFEYMASGRAIVASNLDQMGDVLEHDRTAWLTRPADVDGLAHGLERLVNDRVLRTRLGGAARVVAQAKHDWLGHTRRIINRLTELNGRSAV